MDHAYPCLHLNRWLIIWANLRCGDKWLLTYRSPWPNLYFYLWRRCLKNLFSPILNRIHWVGLHSFTVGSTGLSCSWPSLQNIWWPSWNTISWVYQWKLPVQIWATESVDSDTSSKWLDSKCLRACIPARSERRKYLFDGISRPIIHLLG